MENRMHITQDVADEALARFRAYQVAPLGLAAAYGAKIADLDAMRRVLVGEAMRRGAGVQHIADTLGISRPTVYAWGKESASALASLGGIPTPDTDPSGDLAAFAACLTMSEPEDEPWEPTEREPPAMAGPPSERVAPDASPTLRHLDAITDEAAPYARKHADAIRTARNIAERREAIRLAQAWLGAVERGEPADGDYPF